MELRESADGLRWEIGRGGAMAVIWAQIAKTASRVAGGIEPDVHLIKQVEQVTTPALEGPCGASPGFRALGVTDAVEILIFMIWQLLHWLLFGCKNSHTARRGPRATCGNAAGPNRRFYEPGHIGSRTVALQIRETAITSEAWLAAQISK